MPAPRRALGRRGFAACRRPPRGAWHPTPCRRLRSALHGPWRGLEGALPGVRQSTWGVPPRSPAFSHARQGGGGPTRRRGGRRPGGSGVSPPAREAASGQRAGRPAEPAAQLSPAAGGHGRPLGEAIDGGRVGAPRGRATWAQPGSGVVVARRWPRARSFL